MRRITGENLAPLRLKQPVDALLPFGNLVLAVGGLDLGQARQRTVQRWITLVWVAVIHAPCRAVAERENLLRVLQADIAGPAAGLSMKSLRNFFWESGFQVSLADGRENDGDFDLRIAPASASSLSGLVGVMK